MAGGLDLAETMVMKLAVSDHKLMNLSVHGTFRQVS